MTVILNAHRWHTESSQHLRYFCSTKSESCGMSDGLTTPMSRRSRVMTHETHWTRCWQVNLWQCPRLEYSVAQQNGPTNAKTLELRWRSGTRSPLNWRKSMKPV